MLLASACAEGAALDDDDDIDPIRRTPIDGGASDATSSSTSSSGGGSSSSGSSGASSGGASSSSGSSGTSGTSDAGPDAGPPTACQQALASILFDVEASTPPELGSSWSVGVSDGVTGSWPFQPWVFSSNPSQVIPTKCANDNCVGTSLSSNYAQCQRGWIATPEADLSACAGKDVVVKFDHAYAFNIYGTYQDGGIVEVTGNGASFGSATWTRLDSAAMPGTVKIRGALNNDFKCLSDSSFYVNNKRGYVGLQTTTQTAELTLPAAALTAHARLRFVFASGVAAATTDADTSRASTNFGWRVDNVRFEQKP